MALITFPHLLSCLIIFLIILPKSTSDYLYSMCSNTTVAKNTQYQTNLNTLFRSLSSNATSNPNGFHYTSVAAGTKDAVYGLFLCRGDQNITSCSDCVVAATTYLPDTECPNKKVTASWYDECMIRYSNTSFYQKMDIEPRFRLENTRNITGNMTMFKKAVNELMYNLSARAINGSIKKYATGSLRYTSLQTLYGLVQCTPDLNSSQCLQCLQSAVKVLPISLGGRTVQASCHARYEVYPFFNGAARLAPPPPAEAPKSASSTPLVNNSTGRSQPLSPSPPSGGRKRSTRVVIAVVVPVATFFFALLVMCICFFCKRTKKRDVAVVGTNGSEDFKDVESLQFDFTTIQRATNNFSNEKKLGEGGFSAVYKGNLPDGTEIAVKKLSRSSAHGLQDFKNEVLLLVKLQHRNLVRFLGFCLAATEKLLVYEYVPNKSLDNFLFNPDKKAQLDWTKRYKIIQGIARGMMYLHQDSRLTIIHRDLKASNILLDGDMNPKISDFGLAKMFGNDQTEGNTSRAIGTYGYMSPEYAMHGQFSTKSDVYSFGVLVLEIVSGKENSSSHDLGDDEDLLNYAWQKWNEGVPMDIIDPALNESYSSHEVFRCIHLGLLCVHESADQRPTMGTIMLTLESNSVTLPMPQEPAFFTKTKVRSNESRETGSDQSASKSVHWSVNNVSFSEIEPR